MEILPHLWIGYYSDKFIRLIKEKNIKNIIHLSKNNSFTKIQNIEEIRVPIDYNEDDTYEHMNNMLYQQLFDITDYIHNKIINNQKVLLIGHDYRQDIDSILIAYYMRYGKLTIRDSIIFLKSKKYNIFSPKCLFYDALNRFYNF